jgi:hypothetical protein
MTMREYFIAHAPAEPQPWFKPAMEDQPILPSPAELCEQDRDAWHREDMEYSRDSCSEALLDFDARHTAALNARTEWSREKQKQTYIQWPLAWADEIIAALEQQS